jgi:hypothetical protein
MLKIGIESSGCIHNIFEFSKIWSENPRVYEYGSVVPILSAVLSRYRDVVFHSNIWSSFQIRYCTGRG